MKQALSAVRATIRSGALVALVILTGTIFPSNSNEASPITKEDVAQMITSLSNWGRWGKEDQLGTLNLITPSKRKEAAALVQEGVSISLAHNVIKTIVFNSPAFDHYMLLTGQSLKVEGSGDLYCVNYHGYTQTHMDALCHFSYQGRMYNGFSLQEVTSKGAGKLSVINVKNGIFTRGVLMDFPRLFGVKYLAGRRAITPDDIDAWEKKTGVKIEPGDVLLVRTGHWARYEAEGEWEIEKGSAGLDVSCLPWLKKHDVAVLGSDLASDVLPSGVEGISHPVHLVTIVAMGTPILDNCDLEALGEAAAARQRWTFLFTAGPLAVDGGTGSPLNPIATF